MRLKTVPALLAALLVSAVAAAQSRSLTIDDLYDPASRVNFSGNAAPTAQDRNFVCIEPMAGITDGINLAHKGRYRELQSVAPGGVWHSVSVQLGPVIVTQALPQPANT